MYMECGMCLYALGNDLCTFLFTVFSLAGVPLEQMCPCGGNYDKACVVPC